jgi:sporulation protein YlmC with PRC-barrel domain
VVDSAGDRLGTLIDLKIDGSTGNVLAMLVRLEDNLDPTRLPWELDDEYMQVPVEEVDRIATSIHLKR